MKTEKRKRLENATQGQALLALEKLKEELKRAIEEGRAQQTKNEIVSVFAQRWLQSLAIKRRGKIKPATLETRTIYLERFVLPYVGHLEPKMVTPSLLERDCS